jgi:hypothetical protein
MIIIYISQLKVRLSISVPHVASVYYVTKFSLVFNAPNQQELKDIKSYPMPITFKWS